MLDSAPPSMGSGLFSLLQLAVVDLSLTPIFCGNDEVVAAKWQAVPEGPWNLAGGVSHRNPSPPRLAPAGAVERMRVAARAPPGPRVKGDDSGG